MAIPAVITGALAIADAVGLTSWVGNKIAGDVGESVANKITDIAIATTSTSSPEEALKALSQDTALRTRLQEQILSQEHEILLADYEDKKGARAMYTSPTSSSRKTADKIAMHIIHYNLLYVAITLIVECLALYFFRDQVEILTIVSTACGWILKGLLDERREVGSFYFGASLPSVQEEDGKK